MTRYIILIIIVITLVSLLSLFEKPMVNQYSQNQPRGFTDEKTEEQEDVKKTSQMIYNQSDMDFLINAYGVGLP